MDKINQSKPTCPRDCQKIKQASSWTIEKCGQLLYLGLSGNGKDLYINNKVLHSTALQLLEWARDQPSPLIRKDDLKMLFADALQDDIQRRIFKDYLKVARNCQKKSSWIHTTTVGDCEYAKLNSNGID